MTYSRREVVDNETVVDKDHYDNLQDGIDEALKGNQDAKAYTDQQISLITETGIPKLVVEVQPIVAEIEGQTEFEIDLSTYDERTDTLMFYSGVTKLSPNKDYTLEGNKVILTRGLPLGRTGDIYIFKNVLMGEDGSVSGKVIAPNTLPADRIDCSVPLSGSLGIANNLGGFYADINGVLINQYETKGDFNNRRGVWVHSKSHTGLTSALQFFTIENGADKMYNIFGEHNTDLLASTIKDLIDSGVISMSAIKSVQRGIITIASGKTTGTATISSVNTSKAVVIYGGSIWGGASGGTSGNWDARLVLKSATQVEAARSYANSTAIVPYQVIEFA